MKQVNQNIVYWITALMLLNATSGVSQCNPPANGNWTILQDCTLTKSAIIRGNVYVRNNATLTIASGHDLNIDLEVNRIEVEHGAHVVVKNGGRIHTVLIDDTDGRVGYYLKKVNGPVLRALNEDVSFYPASTIKVLQHAYAMQSVQEGFGNLNNSILAVCPNNSNCTNNFNSLATCGAAPIFETLSTALNRMMVNSDNQSTNAVQEFFGAGSAATGRAAMNAMAAGELGLSNGTRLHHKFACNNINNNPFNIATLEDLAKLYEEVGEDSNFLSAATKVDFYQLMLNESNDNSFLNKIRAIVDNENLEVGLTAAELSAFKNQINSARKAGSVSCCRSNAGWIELPFNNGQSSDQYVFSLFFDSFTTNSVDMNQEFADLLRPVIRKTLEKW